RALGARRVELLEAAPQDHAAPAPGALVAVDLEAHLGVLPHHRELSALDRVHVEARAVVGVDDRDDVRLAAGVAADPPDQLLGQEVVDLGTGQLLHRLIVGRPGPAATSAATVSAPANREPGGRHAHRGRLPAEPDRHGPGHDPGLRAGGR